MKLREIPVRRAAVYAPSGRHPYPSTVVMGAITARAAGVDEVVVATAPHPVLLAAARLCGVDAVYRITGAQAIAALAYGTESIPRVDVIVGPGSLWVQEAKRQVSGVVGIDGFAGPSDLTVIATKGADVEALKLDLAAQAEHGEGSLTVGDQRRRGDHRGARRRRRTASSPTTSRPRSRLAEALAPEHLQLAGEAAEALAPAHPQRRLPVRRQRVRAPRSATTSPAPTTRSHRGRRPLRLRPQRAPLPAPDGRGPPPRRRARARRRRRADRRGRGLRRARRLDGGCVRIDDRDPHRPAQPQDRRDRRRA